MAVYFPPPLYAEQFPRVFAVMENNKDSVALMKKKGCSVESESPRSHEEEEESHHATMPVYTCGGEVKRSVLFTACDDDKEESSGDRGGRCCQAQAAMTYLLSREEMRNRTKWIVVSDDAHYYHPPLFLSYLDFHDWTLPLSLVSEQPLRSFTAYPSKKRCSVPGTHASPSNAPMILSMAGLEEVAPGLRAGGLVQQCKAFNMPLDEVRPGRDVFM